MENERIDIAREFSLRLGGRFKKLGPFSGELFYETILQPRFLKADEKKCKLEIILDGTKGYGSSFLDESFGKLAKTYGLNKVKNTLVFINTTNFQWVVDYINQNVWKED